jgi:hypothetical protein
MSLFSLFFRKNFCYGIDPPIEMSKYPLYKGGYPEGGGGTPYGGSGMGVGAKQYGICGTGCPYLEWK